jgi:hypothetical protein
MHELRPGAVQKMLFAALAPIARLMGYKVVVSYERKPAVIRPSKTLLQARAPEVLSMDRINLLRPASNVEHPRLRMVLQQVRFRLTGTAKCGASIPNAS